MRQRASRLASVKRALSVRSGPRAALYALGCAVLLVAVLLPDLIQTRWRTDEQPPSPAFAPGEDLFANVPRSTLGLDPEPDASGLLIDWESSEGPTETRPIPAETVDFDCMIEPWETVSIRSPVVGRIDAIHVERADLVEQGVLLLELDADLAHAEYEVARERVEMEASIRARQAAKERGQMRGKRARELFRRNAIALEERDDILMEGEIADWEYQDAIEQRALARKQLDRELARYERRRVRSPFSGIVADRLMSVGEIVDDETILELAQIDPLRVEVVLPAAEFGTVQRGMKAAVVPEIPGDDVVVATVRVVDRIIDSASGTFGAELELPNPDHRIPGGLRCHVRFLATETEPETSAERADEAFDEAAPEEQARAETSTP